MRELSGKQREFCHLLTTPKPEGGMRTHAEAYEAAGFKARGMSARASATKLTKKPHVVEYLAVLRAKAEAATGRGRAEWLKSLWGLADSADSSAASVAALAQIGKAQAYYPAEKHDVGGTVTIEVVKYTEDEP